MSQDLLERIALGLDERGIGYMVIGGQAVLLHGEVRATADIDVTLGVDVDRLSDILGLAKEAGWRLLVPAPADFVARTMVLPCQDDASGMRIDFIFSTLDYERQAIQRGVAVNIGKSMVRFASAEDLLVLKMVAGRARDLDDARSVLLKNPGLDIDYVRCWLREFEVVLEQPLTARFDALLGGTKR